MPVVSCQRAKIRYIQPLSFLFALATDTVLTSQRSFSGMESYTTEGTVSDAPIALGLGVFMAWSPRTEWGGSRKRSKLFAPLTCSPNVPQKGHTPKEHHI